MPRETVITPPIRGAARTIDSAHPSPQTETVGNVTLGLNWIDRQGFGFADRGTITTFGVQPAGSGWDIYRGRVTNKITGSGTSGAYYLASGMAGIYFPQTAAGIGGDFNDDQRCWRVVLIYAVDGSGLGSGDLGLEVGAALNYNIIAGTAPGFQVAPTAAGQISFRVRQNGGGGLTVNQVVANVDVNDFHAYELRFIGATKQQDAIVKVFIDGVQVAAQAYGAGTLLPDWGNGATLGYSVGYGNRGGNAAFVPKMACQLSSAATEAGLL